MLVCRHGCCWPTPRIANGCWWLILVTQYNIFGAGRIHVGFTAGMLVTDVPNSQGMLVIVNKKSLGLGEFMLVSRQGCWWPTPRIANGCWWLMLVTVNKKIPGAWRIYVGFMAGISGDRRNKISVAGRIHVQISDIRHPHGAPSQWSSPSTSRSIFLPPTQK